MWALLLFLEACLISPWEVECNVLYVITSQKVLERQAAQCECDCRLADYLESRGYQPDLSESYRRYTLIDNLLRARDIYSYSRAYYLEEAKTCN